MRAKGMGLRRKNVTMDIDNVVHYSAIREQNKEV